MSIIALDLGTTTGWAASTTGRVDASGVWKCKADRFAGGGMRFLRFRELLNALHGAYDPIDRLVFEEVRAHRGVDAAHAYGGYLATLQAWCEENKIPYEGVPVGTIKAHCTGKGNASKEAMMIHVRKLGYWPKTDDEADAIALLRYVLDQKKECGHAGIEESVARSNGSDSPQGRVAAG